MNQIKLISVLTSIKQPHELTSTTSYNYIYILFVCTLTTIFTYYVLLKCLIYNL